MIRYALVLAAAFQPVPQTQDLSATHVMPPPSSEIMKVPEELRDRFRREVLEKSQFPEVRLEKLVKFVFDKQGLGITYQADATHTIAESYQTRTVNCLSSTLLFVALAREAGLKAHGQQVSRILAWSGAGGVAVQVQHANAIIDVASKRSFIVDVDASDLLATDSLSPVSDEQLLAYFYSNRGMELLTHDRLPEAKIWVAEALRYAPMDATILNNAGVLNLRVGDMEAAEASFKKAIEINPDQISVLSNLVSFYQRRGDVARTALWQNRSERALQKAPYYQYFLGQQLELSGDMKGAIQRYRRAISLNNQEHRFHFALARVYFDNGELHKATRALVAASKISEGDQQHRYEEKLAVLRRMHHSSSSPVP